jgi:hypothetical protein
MFNNFGRYHREISAWWKTILICIRNNYIIKDQGEWFDHLRLLEYFGKDLHSAKYVCPENFSKAHQRLIANKRRIEKKQEIEARKQQIAIDNEKFQEEKRKYFDLCLSAGGIKVIPLKTIEEYIHEGDELKHCVYTNEYYKRKNSLIMSARKAGKILETIEVDLIDMEVVQSRGLKNQNSKYHDQILKLVNENIPAICQIN